MFAGTICCNALSRALDAREHDLVGASDYHAAERSIHARHKNRISTGDG